MPLSSKFFKITNEYVLTRTKYYQQLNVVNKYVIIREGLSKCKGDFDYAFHQIQCTSKIFIIIDSKLLSDLAVRYIHFNEYKN